MADTRHTIFISYSRTDSDFVDRLEGDLQARNFGTWVDRLQLEGGQTWVDEIQHAIDLCDIMLVVVTPDALASPWVQKEYVYALGERKHVLPVLLQSVPKPPVALYNIQNISFVTDYDAGLKSLLLALTTIAFIPPPPAPEIPRTPITSDPDDVESGEDLVVVHPPLPQPSPDLAAYYDAGFEARAQHDLDAAAVWWGYVFDHDPDFNSGFLKQQLAKLNADLKPTREQRAHDRALRAMKKEEWRQAIGAWQALLGLNPESTLAAEARQGMQNALRGRAKKAHQQGAWGEELGAWEALLKLAPNDTEAKDRIPIARQNQEGDLLYASATSYVEKNNPETAREILHDLWQFCPYYGDPKGVAARIGEKVPPSYGEVKAAEAAAKAEADRKAAEAETLRKKQLADAQTEADRKAAEAKAAAATAAAAAFAAADRKAAEDQANAERVVAAALAAERVARNKSAAAYRRPYFIERRLKSDFGWILLWACCLLGGIGVTAGYVAYHVSVFNLVRVSGVAIGWPENVAIAVIGASVVGALLMYGLGYWRAVHLRVLWLAAAICAPIAFGLASWAPGFNAFHIYAAGIQQSNISGLLGAFASSEAIALCLVLATVGAIVGGVIGASLGSDGGAVLLIVGLILGIIGGSILGGLLGAIVGFLLGYIVGAPILILGFVIGVYALGLTWGILGGLAVGPDGGDGVGALVIYGIAAGCSIIVGAVGAVVGVFGWDAAGWLILATLIGTTAGIGLGTSSRVWWQAWVGKRPSVDELLAFADRTADSTEAT